MGWISLKVKEALRRFKQRRKIKKREKLFRAHKPYQHSSNPSTTDVNPIVKFSGKDIILKSCTPVKPPADPSMAVRLRRSSVDIWDGVEEHRREITKRNQRTSAFLRLAAEVRNMIYTYALGGRTFRFKDLSLRGHARLDPKGERHVLALLLVCHQIYSEASLLPYSLNAFSFREFEHSLNPFLDHRQYAQFQAITVLELVTYQAERMWAGPHEECEVVKEIKKTRAWERLPNLQEIRVIVDLNESLYVQYGSRDFNFREIRDNQSAFEDEVRTWRPLILVRFFWA